MARGWESKEVESQIEAKEQARREREAVPTAQDAERETIDLQRRRILHELDAASHPRHKAMLEEALRHLDQKLAALGGDAKP